MQLDPLREKLIAAARRTPASDRVPLAFEKRIMARIGNGAPLSSWALWARPMWSAAASCAAITVLCGIWFFTARPHAEPADSFSQDFERTVFSSVNQHVEEAW
jgi:hypothetical protein